MAQEARSAATTIPGLQPPRGHGRHHVPQETEMAYPSGRGLPRTCSHVPKPGAVLLPIVHMKKLKLGERVETLGDSQAPAGECRSRGTLLGDQGQLVQTPTSPTTSIQVSPRRMSPGEAEPGAELEKGNSPCRGGRRRLQSMQAHLCGFRTSPDLWPKRSQLGTMTRRKDGGSPRAKLLLSRGWERG